MLGVQAEVKVSLSEEYIRVEDEKILSYGIYFFDETRKICISDVSTNIEVVTKFIDIICKHSVSTLHIRELLDDFLAGAFD